MGAADRELLYSQRMRRDGLRTTGTASTTTHIAISANPKNSKTNASTTQTPDEIARLVGVQLRVC